MFRGGGDGIIYRLGVLAYPIDDFHGMVYALGPEDGGPGHSIRQHLGPGSARFGYD
ncbi:hypothetical protein SDC9_146732 [bioreactor metagenome]|uniref:Uncharacterized protein n=1 Tax=bioreactor metagenome TaxID=1076179 RepID=A0A645ECH0_9ZZZZ